MRVARGVRHKLLLRSRGQCSGYTAEFRERYQRTKCSLCLCLQEKAAQLAKEAAVERGADEAMLKTRLEADHQHHVNELEKARRRRADALDGDTYWKKQIDLERAQRNEEHVSDLERARLEDRLVAEEEKEFQRYASEVRVRVRVQSITYYSSTLSLLDRLADRQGEDGRSQHVPAGGGSEAARRRRGSRALTARPH